MMPPLTALLRLHELCRDASPSGEPAQTAEYARLADSLSRITRQRYERALRRYGHHAVVQAERGVCKGCYVKQPAIPEKLDEDIIQCQSCGRLLYDPDRAFDLTSF